MRLTFELIGGLLIIGIVSGVTTENFVIDIFVVLIGAGMIAGAIYA